MVKRDEHIRTNESAVRDTDQPPGTASTPAHDAEPGMVCYRPEMGSVIVRYEPQDSGPDRAALP